MSSPDHDVVDVSGSAAAVVDHRITVYDVATALPFHETQLAADRTNERANRVLEAIRHRINEAKTDLVRKQGGDGIVLP